MDSSHQGANKINLNRFVFVWCGVQIMGQIKRRFLDPPPPLNNLHSCSCNNNGSRGKSGGGSFASGLATADALANVVGFVAGL